MANPASNPCMCDLGINPLYTGNSLTNSGDPDDMQHNEGMHFLLRLK